MSQHKRTAYRVRLIMGRWYVLYYGGRGDIELGSNDFGDIHTATRIAEKSGLHNLDNGVL